ncbi:MAG: hypothetical protein AAGA54_19720 [Myxococcota bacterium]
MRRHHAQAAPRAFATADVYLAVGCVLGLSEAVVAFRRAHEADIDTALSRLRIEPGTAGDVKSAVLEKLLAPGSTKLQQFAGGGPLGRWVAAVTAREAASVRRTAARRRGLLEAAGEAITPADPELAFLKQHYRGAFREAFTLAVEDLDPKERALLRNRFVDGLTLPQLAAASGVHRATAARWLADVRTTLLERTRAHMVARLKIGPDELQSIFRLIQSNFEVSVHRLLQEA